MIRTVDIMKMLKARHGNISNRELAKKIGLSNYIVNICFRGHSLSVDNALRFADELGLDRYAVLIGNLCEKHLVSQQAREMLAALIGEDIKLKPDRITEVLREASKKETTHTDI
ncbi:hypothetical protein [Vibrio panuliri]|uniref:HTH cro/C1-type domain-containing protein n=1 Tax=Vibrio panuliri TaxID=1381081 RepID=A0ABX3FI78_9VIBR|nr:hypothetical protein [Vibrio panuliri]KAB1457409.1 hypothetical protein F7O85_06615 [Vibrio panuliri]OLQ91430.1 hypothetical protein BIY20_01065 [Vibrio panuliri]